MNNPDFELSDPDEHAMQWIPKMKKANFSVLVTIKNESSIFFENVDAKGWFFHSNFDRFGISSDQDFLFILILIYLFLFFFL